VLSSIALGLNLGAVFVDGRARENIMYCRDNVFAYCLLVLIIQIFDFFSLHETFGPWSVIIQNLMFDVVKFLSVLFVFLGAFSMHMCVVYKPAYNKKRVDFPTSLTPFNVKGSYEIILKDLWWAILGFGNIPTELTAEERNDNPAQTYYIASVGFALFQIVTVVVLMNLLIAMMGNTYAVLDERSVIEWKFGRARVIWFMTKSTSVPIPINMLTTFIRIVKIVYKARCCCCTANVNKMYQEMTTHAHAMADLDDDTEKLGQPKNIKTVIPWRECIAKYKMFNQIEDDDAMLDIVDGLE